MKDWRSKLRKYTGHECFVDGDKHNFQPVFENSDLVKIGRDVEGDNYLSKIYTLNKKYLYHICKWCGKIIKMDE